LFAVFAWVAFVTVATVFAWVAFGALISLVTFEALLTLRTLRTTRALQIPLHELLTGGAARRTRSGGSEQHTHGAGALVDTDRHKAIDLCDLRPRVNANKQK
jgi:hypothetical protein